MKVEPEMACKKRRSSFHENKSQPPVHEYKLSNPEVLEHLALNCSEHCSLGIYTETIRGFMAEKPLAALTPWAGVGWDGERGCAGDLGESADEATQG